MVFKPLTIWTGLTLVVLVASPSTAQPGGIIRGVVTDERTGAPIEGATVRVNSSDVHVTTTNASGVYEVPDLPAGQYWIGLSKLGYVSENSDGFQCRGGCDFKATLVTLAAGATLIANAALEPLASVSGTVRDAGSLAPLSGHVSFYSVEGVHLAIANFDATGGYSYIQYLDPGTYFLKVPGGPGYVTELHDNIACVAIDCLVTSGTPVVLTAPGHAATVDFALATAGRFSGTVRSADGSVVPGVQVDVYNASTSYVATVATGSDGTYAVGGLAAGTYLARAASKLYAGLSCATSDCRIASGTPITVNAGATTTGIDFSFDAAPAAAALSGTVMQDGSSTPLGGVPVRAYAGDLLVASGTTNGLGRSSVTVPAGAYRVRTDVTPANYVDEWQDGRCVGCAGTSPVVVVGSGATIGGLNFSLAPGGAISGRIACATTTADFTVPPGISVFNSAGVLVRRGESPFGVCTPTGVDYLISGLAAGQYYLLARDTPFVAFGTRPSGGILIDKLYGEIPCAAVDCDVRRGAPVTVTAGGTTTGIDFGMTKGASFGGFAGSEKLTIFDDRGVELTGVIRLVLGLSQQVVGLPPGTYFVKFGNQLHSGITCHDCPPTSGTPIIIRPGDGSLPVTSGGDTSLNFGTPPVRRIGGTIADAVGSAPLSTIGVEVVTGAGQLVARAVTDMFGRYSVGPLAPGTYYVRTSNDRGYVDEVYDNQLCATCDPRTGSPVTVGAGSDVAGIDFALAAGGIISGAVADTDGLALASVPVSLFSGGGALIGRTTSSAAGQFRIALPAGTYRARAEATKTHGSELHAEMPCTSTACDLAAGTPITLAAGGTTSGVNFTLGSCSTMTLSPPMLATGVVGRAYRHVLSASGGVAPFVFDVIDGALPVGVTLDRASGVLSGVPTVFGRHSVRVAALSANGCSTENAYTLDVQACAFTLSPSSVTVPAAGGSVLVTIGDPCGSEQVVVVNDQIMATPIPFVHVQPSPPGQVSLTVDPNTGAAPRGASIVIGRRIFALRQAGVGSMPPFGSLDLPLDRAQVSGAAVVGGWALDDLEVARVLIYRNAFAGEPAGLVFLGTPVFVPGARPDVERAYPTTPRNDRAGFGFMILTNMLPNQGNGEFRIHAIAQDVEGRETVLGSRTIFGLNASATQPFGTIDTPAQGETIAGQNYLNWGWALTPQPAMIPTDGSTIQVIVDGAPVGNPIYNLFRPDVSGLFPGLANTSGPVGYRALDTTALAEGLHTVSWTVTDTLGGRSGLGSRYFTVANAADAQPPPGQGSVASASGESNAREVVEPAAAEAAATPVGVPSAPHNRRRAASLEPLSLSDADVTIQRQIGRRQSLRAGDNQPRELTIAPLERIELALDAPSKQCVGTWSGYLVRGEVLSDLPVGASLDPSGTVLLAARPGLRGTLCAPLCSHGLPGHRAAASRRSNGSESLKFGASQAQT